MKRVITIAFVTMLALVLALSAYGTEQATDVIFEVGSNYKLYIPPTATLNIDSLTGNGIGTMNIYFTECHVNGVNIQLKTNDNFEMTWHLRGTQDINNILPYTISCGGNTVQPENDLFVSKDGVLSLQLTVTEANLKKAMGDTYRDRLIFKFQ